MTREEAIHELQEDKRLYETEVCHAGDGSLDGRLLEALDMAIEALNTDIVRCEECKKQFTNNCYMIYGKNMMRNLFDNDFCSYGERRE